MNLIHVATSDFKNSPVFTDLSIHACKTFIPLATGSSFVGTALSTAFLFPPVTVTYLLNADETINTIQVVHFKHCAISNDVTVCDREIHVFRS